MPALWACPNRDRDRRDALTSAVRAQTSSSESQDDAAIARSDASAADAPEADSALAAITPSSAPRADGGSPSPRRAYNVLYLTIDSLRGDVLFPRGTIPAAFGEDPARFAPTLTALAARGVTYTRAYALSSYTSMSVGGMYGCAMPGELPRDGYFFGEYRNRTTMLAERLSAQGVHTMAAHAHFYFRRGSSNLEQGFARWEVIPNLQRVPTTDVEITSPRHVALVQRLLSEPVVRDRPWFLHAHFLDPHDQYHRHPGSPPPVALRGVRANYLSEVWFADQHIGRLIEWVQQQPWADRTAIIISADHGEAFGEHGHTRHGFYLWEELIRVPWIFLVPGAAPRRIDVARSHLDLGPTILDLMGLPAAPELKGRSLRAELEGGAADPRVVWVDLPQTSNNDRWRARIEGDIEAISRGDNDATFFVYDLQADPGERSPLPRTDPRRAQAIERFRAERSQWNDVAPDQWRPVRAP